MHDDAVHLVDDDAAFRDSLATLLAPHGYRVFEHADAFSFLDMVGRAPQGCALIDASMPEMDGMTLQRELNARDIRIPVVIVTGFGDIAMAVQAMKAGAVDFLEKPLAPAKLLKAVAAALGREPPPARGDPELAGFAPRLVQLTGREREVLEGIVAGHSTKVIAHRLQISPRTVDVHRFRIGGKLGVTGLSNLVRLALAAGVTSGARWR